MLALAVLGLLAVASPADTAVRVPGTTLRFGLADTVLAARGFAPAGSRARQGRCRFFGLTSDATLSFEDGRLARVEIAVSDASSSELAYVHDQLTAMGYRRNCETLTPRKEVCDWTGRTRIHLEMGGGSLSASVVSALAPPVAPAHPPAAAAASAPGTAAPAIAPPGNTPAPAETTALAPDGATRTAATAVPVLPETLAVDLPGRPSRYAPATLLGEPRCPYPEAARAAGVQGRVWVFAFVDTDGRVLRAQLKSGIPVLDAAALACARNWRFEPVAWRGAPCRFWVLAPVTFTVH